MSAGDDDDASRVMEPSFGRWIRPSSIVDRTSEHPAARPPYGVERTTRGRRSHAEPASDSCPDERTTILANGVSLNGSAWNVLVGLSIASKLARTSSPEAIDALKTALPALRGYAWGLAWPAAGPADLRAYDAGSAERKTLGRDAILTAFGELAKVGVLENASMSKARARLATLFPSRRIDALDELLLPRWTAPPPADVAERALERARQARAASADASR